MSKKKTTREVQFEMPWGVVAAKSWGPESSLKKVLAAHGLFDNLGSFDRLIPLLPDDIHYVCIDFPGHGLSSHFPAGTAINYLDYVYVIPRVLDRLGWKSCIYLGHSLLGLIGLISCALFPNRFDGMILLDGILPLVVDNEYLVDFMRKMYDSVQGGPSKLFTKDEVIYMIRCQRVSSLNTEAAQALFERAVTRVKDGLYKINSDSRIRCLRPVLNLEQQISLMKSFTAPILALNATSSLKRRNAEKIRERFEKTINSDKPIFRGITIVGNHDMHNNTPELVAPYIRDFLNSFNTEEVKSKL